MRVVSHSCEVVVFINAHIVQAFFFVRSSDEVEEVLRPVLLVVEVLWSVHYQAVPHVFSEVNAIEIVVPQTTVRRNEVEAEELVAKDDLDSFIVGLIETCDGHVLSGLLLVLKSPLETLRSQPVHGETAAALGEGAGADDGVCGIPVRVNRLQLGMHSCVSSRQTTCFRGLSMNPAKRL